jgi:glycosyltransferase involved in cell wall biosynthesis
MKIVNLVTDNREHDRAYSETTPRFVAGHEALLQGFARMQGLELHIVSCTQQPMSSPEKLADNIWFHSLHVPKIGWLRSLYQGCIRAVRKKVRELKPDLVHGHGTERDCAISAVLSGYPNLVTIHGNMVAQERLNKPRLGAYGWLAARLENFTLRRTLGVLCNSIYTEELARSRARRTWLVPHALRMAFFDPPPAPDPRPCVLLNAGLISPRKQQCELLDVAETLRNRGLKVELRFIGFIPAKDSAYTRTFLKRIKAMEAAGYARFLGPQPEGELVRCFDAVAGMLHFPAEESFGNVVVESLARELKFFGSRLGGIVDITEGVPSAELFAEGDWAGLTNAVARWIEQGHPRPSGAAALMRQRYHPELIARRHIEIYREILGGEAENALTSRTIPPIGKGTILKRIVMSMVKGQ